MECRRPEEEQTPSSSQVYRPTWRGGRCGSDTIACSAAEVHIMSLLEYIKHQQEQLIAKVNFLTSKLNPGGQELEISVPIQFPLQSMEGVEDFENWLKNPINSQLKQNLISTLATIGGYDTKRVTWNILAHMFHNDVGRKISWKGLNGKKIIPTDGSKNIPPACCIIRLSEGFHDRYPVEDYLDLFDLAAWQIQDSLTGHSHRGPLEHNLIIGEASASTLWDNNAWMYFYDNNTEDEVVPPFLIQDFIHAVQPNARFIIMLRDPVERLYSDYLYFGIANKSAEDFHEKVSESLQIFEGCLTEYSMRSCVYNTTINNAMPVRLQVGLYVVYILDWLTVYRMEQILVLRLEDHASNRKYTLHKVFDFLNLGPLTKQKEVEITKSPASNTRRPGDKNLGPMLPITKEILRDFYTPFNDQLAKVLCNDSFRWENHSKLI
ncbi:hypothetical protein UPYG_G00329020 [Umbra pygmaea]|uniref:Sulfotransferase n=1 Tax=Umbra pygmaea TaxID=75934 RepID=A0ABD0WJF2_UMBPY